MCGELPAGGWSDHPVYERSDPPCLRVGSNANDISKCSSAIPIIARDIHRPQRSVRKKVAERLVFPSAPIIAQDQRGQCIVTTTKVGILAGVRCLSRPGVMGRAMLIRR